MQTITRPTKPTKIDDCEGSNCNATNVEVWRMHGNMFLCAACRELELSIMNVQEEQVRAKSTIQQFQKVDSQINLQTDIHNAHTVEIMSLRAAIYANAEIPDDKKEQAFTDLMLEHYLRYKEAVKQTQTLLSNQQNAMRAFQVNGQEAAGRLSAELQAKYAEFKVNYTPTVVKPSRAAGVERKASGERAPVVRYKDIKSALERAGISNPSVSVLSNILFVANNKKKPIEEVVKDYVASLTA